MPAKLKIDREEFVKLANEGLSNKELREHFQVCEASICRLRKLTGTSAAVRLTPERKARIAAMLDDGWSFDEISRTEGAARDTLERHFPGRQWTKEQQREYLSTLRKQNPHFNKHPGPGKRYDKEAY